MYYLATLASCLVGAGMFTWLWQLPPVRPVKFVVRDSGFYNEASMTTDSDVNGLV